MKLQPTVDKQQLLYYDDDEFNHTEIPHLNDLSVSGSPLIKNQNLFLFKSLERLGVYLALQRIYKVEYGMFQTSRL